MIYHVKGSVQVGGALGDLFRPIVAEIARIQPDYMTDVDSQVMDGHRAIGVYRYGTAEGRLERANVTGSKDNRGWGYRLHLKFEKLEDGQKLYDLVFSGAIRPTTPYEEPQVRYRIPEHLSEREWAVASQMVRGLTNMEIAASMGCSARSVKSTVASILASTGARNRIEFILGCYMG